MPHVKLSLLGPPQLEIDQQPIDLSLRKTQALLAYLATTGQPHSRDALATLLWPESGQRAARASLRRTLYELGQRVEGDLLRVSTDRVAIEPSLDLWLDVDAFRSRAEAGLAQPGHVTAPNVTARNVTALNVTALNVTALNVTAFNVTVLQEAAELYTDHFMAGFSLNDSPEFDTWQFFQREDLNQTLSTVLQRLTETHEAQGCLDEAVLTARRWLSLDPLHEPVQRTLMRLYARNGQQAAALRQYEECVRLLDEELGVAPAEETDDLFEAIRTRSIPGASQTIPTQPVTPDAHSGAAETSGARAESTRRLPIPPTPFVGRAQELEEITRRIADPTCRLLTLVGPGGIGKTRLALETASRLLAQKEAGAPWLQDGLYFVPLQPVATADVLPTAVADGVGFRFRSDGSGWQQLLDYLQQQQLLLVLDNFEHLLDGVDRLRELLAGCPGIKLLVTSREALNLREEWFHPLTGMRYSPETAETPPVEAGAPILTDAVQLFMQHARQAQPDFDAETHLPDVMRICQMVDGFPLAIELAAAWLRVLSPADIVEELQRDHDILTGYARDLPQRHRSMRVVLEQSWQMLSPTEQNALCDLSVFRGGFTRDAARRVANLSYPTLAALVGKAFVTSEDQRYAIHELLRQFAGQKLETDPSHAQRAQQRHADHYLSDLAAQLPRLNSGQQQNALTQIKPELNNIRAAWAHGVTHYSPGALLHALEPLNEVYMILSQFEEAHRVFTAAQTRLNALEAGKDSGVHDELQGSLLIFLAGICTHLGWHDQASGYIEEAQRHTLTPETQVRFHKFSSEIVLAYGDRAGCETHLRSGLAISTEAGYTVGIARCLNALSGLLTSFGEFARGQELAQQCLDTARQVGRTDYIAHALGTLAWATNCLGLYQESEQYWRECLSIYQAIDDQHGMAMTLNFLGWEMWCQGDERLAESRVYQERALAQLRKLGSRSYLVMALADFALLTNELGDFETARRCATEGKALAEQLNMPTYAAYNGTGLGVAQAGLGRVRQGVQTAQAAVQTHFDTGQTPQCLLALYYLTHLVVCYGTQETGTQETGLALNDAQIRCIARCVAEHPFTYHPIRDRAWQLCEELTASLDSEETRALEEIVSWVL